MAKEEEEGEEEGEKECWHIHSILPSVQRERGPRYGKTWTQWRMIAPWGKHHSRRFIPNRPDEPSPFQHGSYRTLDALHIRRNFSVQWTERQLIWSPHRTQHRPPRSSPQLYCSLLARFSPSQQSVQRGSYPGHIFLNISSPIFISL